MKTQRQIDEEYGVLCDEFLDKAIQRSNRRWNNESNEQQDGNEEQGVAEEQGDGVLQEVPQG